jgi:hypothetical protein
MQLPYVSPLSRYDPSLIFRGHDCFKTQAIYEYPKILPPRSKRDRRPRDDDKVRALCF